MKITKDTVILLIGLAGITSTIFSFWQGYFNIQIYYFLGIVGVATFILLTWYKKASKDKNWKEVLKSTDSIESAISTMGLSEKVNWMEKYPRPQKYWDVNTKGNPHHHIVRVDASTSEVVGLALETSEKKSSLETEKVGDRFPPQAYAPSRRKEQVKTEIRRELESEK